MSKHHYISKNGEAEISYASGSACAGGRWSVWVRHVIGGTRFSFTRDFESFKEAESWLLSYGRSKWREIGKYRLQEA